MKVFKFGGSSVKDAASMSNIKDIISQYASAKLVVVISAMGKTTNRLESIFKTYLHNEEAGLDALDSLISDHEKVCEELGLDADKVGREMRALMIDNLSQVATTNNRSAIYDQIISIGELCSTKIMAEYLSSSGIPSKWMDVRNVILTDKNYREGKVDFAITKNKIHKKVKKYLLDTDVIITQGFIGRSTEGLTTTLGREGSDYTASIFAYSLDVEELTIWKDVPGILTADPRRFENVELLDKLSYREAIEMTYYGAKVIHPKTIQPIQKKNIRLNVRSFEDTSLAGTTIAANGLPSYPPIIVIQDKVILIQITSNDFSFIAENHMAVIYNRMSELQIKSSVNRNSAISFTLCISHVEDGLLDKFLKSLDDGFSTEVYKDLQLISVRHFLPGTVESLTKDKLVLFEETLDDTIQLVVRPVLQPVEKQ